MKIYVTGRYFESSSINSLDRQKDEFLKKSHSLHKYVGSLLKLDKCWNHHEWKKCRIAKDTHFVCFLCKAMSNIHGVLEEVNDLLNMPLQLRQNENNSHEASFRELFTWQVHDNSHRCQDRRYKDLSKHLPLPCLVTFDTFRHFATLVEWTFMNIQSITNVTHGMQFKT